MSLDGARRRVCAWPLFLGSRCSLGGQSGIFAQGDHPEDIVFGHIHNPFCVDQLSAFRHRHPVAERHNLARVVTDEEKAQTGGFAVLYKIGNHFGFVRCQNRRSAHP